MKKFILSVLLLLTASLSDAIAQIVDESIGEKIVLHIGIIDPTKPDGPIKRSPIRIPAINIDDHTIYFVTSCDGCTLRLINEENDIVVDMIVPEKSSSINLPSFLFGEYEIQIVRGNYCFYGYINL